MSFGPSGDPPPPPPPPPAAPMLASASIAQSAASQRETMAGAAGAGMGGTDVTGGQGVTGDVSTTKSATKSLLGD